MTKRALIAEPDQEEALRQAAILKDDGYEALVFTGGDLVTAVESNPPDVLVLRHERPGNQTGLALVPRLKSVAPGTAIVLTTSDLTPDAIEKNKKQKVHADWFLRLPADRSELVGAARAMPQILEADAAAAEEEKPKARDPSRPPPLPPAGLRSLGQLPKASPRGVGDAVLSADDLTFVEKVFSSIQHVDADAPIIEPVPSAIGDTPDRKLALLRTKLKERERDLAKLSRLWRAREEDLRQQEARVQQKDIEIEGLKLRIAELTHELESTQATLTDKESEWGRQIGETYEQHSLNEAELIQQVAGKEAELNRQKTQLRKLEDAAAAERKDFTGRILEWEKAYADFESHHWKIIISSVEEVERLEAQIRSREADKRLLRGEVRDRDNTIYLLVEAAKRLRTSLFEVENEAGRTEARAVVATQTAIALERRHRRAAEEQIGPLRERLLDVEQDLRKHQIVLTRNEADRRAQIAELAQQVRVGDAERRRLADERAHWRRRAESLESTLSLTTALGEAVAGTMFALDDKKSLIMREQTRVRDLKLDDLNDDKKRLEDSVTDLTTRLGQEEMDHASEHERAEELERDLADIREYAATTETRLQGALEGMTGERDRLTDKLSTTEQHLTTTREDLSGEKHSRQQRELEVANLLERKENELTDRHQRVADLERGLADAKEDLGNLRKTVSSRDDRITELLNRVRDADEKQVQLEGQIYRLDAANSEKEAHLIARDERIAQQSEKLSQRDARIESVEAELKKTQSTVLDRQSQIERLDANIEELRRNIATSREETTATKGELQQRTNELFESERKGSSLTAELQNARADITATGVVVEQLQHQLTVGEARAAELKSQLDDTDARLRSTLGELDVAGQRGDQLRKELADAREDLQRKVSEIDDKARTIAETERARDQVQATLVSTKQMLEQQLASSETEKSELEEQLSQQVGENGALSASLTDAATRIEELQLRSRTLESTLQDREGRIVAQEQVLTRASKTTDEQKAALAERETELVELRQNLEDARSAIEERARWLATRESSIAELKTALEQERTAHTAASAAVEASTKQLAEAATKAQALTAEVSARDKKLADAVATANTGLQQERSRADAVAAELAALQALHAEKMSALDAATAAATQLEEIKKSEAHVRAEFAKLRAQAEKIIGDNKQLKTVVDKAELDRKAAVGEVDKLSAELAELRGLAQSGSAQAQQARADADARAKDLADARAQLQRAQQQVQAATKAKTEAEAEAEAAKARGSRDAAAAVEGQQAEVTRLNKELLEARKAQRDAVAQAQQARAEADQIKKLAAQRMAQQRTSAPPGPTAASLPPAAAKPVPMGVTVEGNPFESPTVAVNLAATNPFEAQSTVLVERPAVPSQARGPGDKG